MSNDEINAVNQNMITSVNELHNLFEDLMSFSNIKLGNVKANPNTFKLYDFINSSIQVFSSSFENNCIEVFNNIPYDTEITTDQSILNMILLNIFSNSLKFARYKGYIKINYQNLEQNDLIIVEDDGIGILQDKIKQIVDYEKKTGEKDRLIWESSISALSLSLNLIEEINGSIKVESEEGKGTKITLILPKNSPKLPSTR